MTTISFNTSTESLSIAAGAVFGAAQAIVTDFATAERDAANVVIAAIFGRAPTPDLAAAKASYVELTRIAHTIAGLAVHDDLAERAFDEALDVARMQLRGEPVSTCDHM